MFCQSLYTVGEKEGPVCADAVLPELPLLLPVPAGQNIQQSHPEGHARKTVQGKSRVQGRKLDVMYMYNPVANLQDIYTRYFIYQSRVPKAFQHI